MNKSLLSICALFLGVLLMMPSDSQTAVVRGIFKDPDYPGKCVIKFDVILNEGQSIRDPYKFCGRIICDKDGAAQFHSCGVEAIPNGCHFGDSIFPKSDYPGCCKRHVIC